MDISHYPLILLGTSLFLLSSYLYRTTYNKYNQEYSSLFDGEDALRHLNPK